jgi:hypothetical protein
MRVCYYVGVLRKTHLYSYWYEEFTKWGLGLRCIHIPLPQLLGALACRINIGARLNYFIGLRTPGSVCTRTSAIFRAVFLFKGWVEGLLCLWKWHSQTSRLSQIEIRDFDILSDRHRNVESQLEIIIFSKQTNMQANSAMKVTLQLHRYRCPSWPWDSHFDSGLSSNYRNDRSRSSGQKQNTNNNTEVESRIYL